MSNTTSLGELVREIEQDFYSGNGTRTSKYVTTDPYEDISRIDAYLNSKHISGDTDSMGREKPFFNIVVAARNIYYRATDIDRKHIEITPSKSSDVVPSFLATVLLHDWMRRENFGTFLNNWGMELAANNSAVVKFVEKGNELHCMVVPWARLIFDPVNFDANPKIEIMELTEAELWDRPYDKEMTLKLTEALQTRTLPDGQQVDTRDGYIKLYEVHGLFPLSYLTGNEEEEDTYQQQMHVVSFVESKEGEVEEFSLFKGREDRDPYMLTSLLPATDGSVSFNGSVKNLFEAQWMMNHSAKSIKDQLDTASKLIFQTSDGNFVGRNVLTAIEQGDILVHKINEPLTQINNGSHDIQSQQSFSTMWKSLASEINGVSESMLGNAPPSGTAWRQVEALLQESHSLFELMTENKALALEDMLRTYVIPHLKKKMDTADEIGAILDEHNITRIDAMYVPLEAKRRFNQKAVDSVIEALETDDFSQLPQFDQMQEEASVKQEMAPLGGMRFFKPSEVDGTTWKQALKDLEWDLTINITGEPVDKNTVLTTLSTALQAVANPAFANNPQAQLVVSKILQATGVISPLEIAVLPQPTPAPADPAMAPQPTNQPA